MGFLSSPITLQSLFGTKRVIGPIKAQLVVSEETNDTLTITKQPVQIGASITDHSYSEPTTLNMTILQQDNSIGGVLSTFGASAFGGGGLTQIYKQFQDLQSSRLPFSVITPKRTYKNMLFAVLACTTDKNTENILSLRCSFQAVVLVGIGVTVVPASRQSSPGITQGIQGLGVQSALSSLAQGVKGLLP